MMVPPLSERPVTDEDEEQFRAESAPRKYTLRQRWANHRAQARRNRPAGAKARVRAWMDADIVDWGIRASITLLIIAGLYAIYTNGVTDGWWPAWGDKPTTAATPTTRPAPTAPATAPTEAAMSGGYQIGPDGILVRPAEHAASIYTKPELPEEAKENTERGAEAAAEYYLATLAYAWNTGDTFPFEAVSDPNDSFRNKFISDIHDTYSSGWTFGNTITIDHILQVNPQPPNGKDVPPNSVLIVFLATTSDGTTCRGKNAVSSAEESQLVFALLMTWRDGTWIAIQGGSESAQGK
ncbi:DUF6318 family protein [Actinomyces bouchesdurhonensis]|uniref:DUF6318 family protein n=1 Tax=Actinomyces bouchesdurhonensis TaxID=1852361 RepID=UPI0028EC1FC9|nr:DUF6318 family protein [Actinomyces bouchesdurhonensis]